MQLVQTITREMSLGQEQSVKRIDAEDFSGVIRKTVEDLEKQGVHASPDYMDEGILALKQYYAIPVFDPLNMHAVSDTIDPFWHAHILHTEQYAVFCREVIGCFMHHDPLDHGVRSEVQRVQFLYDYTRYVMGEMFSYVNPEFYPEMMPEYRLVCTHQNDITYMKPEDETFILPFHSKAQPAFQL